MILRVIVEGADQQGKTTFCKKLSEKLGWEIKHFGKPDDCFDFYADYLTEPNTISDRNYLSEIVYSNFNNRMCKIQKIERLERLLQRHSTIVIVLSRDDSFKFDNKRYEDYVENDIRKAIVYYKELYNTIGLEKYMFKVSDEYINSYVDLVYNLIKARNNDCA